MHRLRLSLLGCLLLASAGCSAPPKAPVVVRDIYVAPVSDAPTPELARFDDVIHDESVRTLRARGFIACMEPGAADAFLRGAWSVASSVQGKVSLRITLEDREGRVLASFAVVTDAHAGFLTKERIADLVRERLGVLGR